MKKILLSMILALALLLPCTALAQTYTFDGVFTMEYPDEWYYVEDSQDPTETIIGLGLLAGEGARDLNVQMDMRYYEDWSDWTLYNLSDEEMDHYIEVLLYDHSEYGAELVEVITSDVDGLSFVIIRGVDSYGDYFYAETMASGWSFGFNGYAFKNSDYDSCRDLTERDYELFVEIIRSFTAIR